MATPETRFPQLGRPEEGLYDPSFEHDACGVGFVVDIKGRKSHTTIERALTILRNLEHRGASGAEVNTGDGAGILDPNSHFQTSFSSIINASRTS